MSQTKTEVKATSKRKNAKTTEPEGSAKTKAREEIGVAANAAIAETSVAMIAVDQIRVQDGFNSRKQMSEEGLDRLGRSFGRSGVAQSIAVWPGEDGGYILAAGHRRFEAAKREGVVVLPAIIFANEAMAHRASLAENFQRIDLNPMEVAWSLKARAEEWGLNTNRAIAEEVSMSEAWVAEHLRLLKLPEGVQTYIAEGHVPVSAERLLRPVAKVSGLAAECICELAKRQDVPSGGFADRFTSLLMGTAERQHKFKSEPTMIATRGFKLSEVFDGEKHQELADRLGATTSGGQTGDPSIYLTEVDVDAARAAGCLIEHKTNDLDWVSAVAYITDKAVAADLTERFIARREKEAEDLAAARAAESEGSKTAAKSAREAAKERALAARNHNEEVGRKLLSGRTEAKRKKRSLKRAQALVLDDLNHDADLAAAGLRMVLPQLRQVEQWQLKSGASRERVVFLDKTEAMEYLREMIMKARTADEVLELWADARVAAMVVDSCELPQSKRTAWYRSDVGGVTELLAADIKAATPKRS